MTAGASRADAAIIEMSDDFAEGFAKCWSKFGGMKMCKTRSAMGMSKQDTWKIRDFITLGGSAVAEFARGAFLGPCEELDAETDVVNGLFFVFGLTRSGKHHAPW